jgi:hypothetical protein
MHILCSVNSLTKDDIKTLPALQAWKTYYRSIAPNLSLCLAVNPCLMNGEPALPSAAGCSFSHIFHYALPVAQSSSVLLDLKEALAFSLKGWRSD